MYSIMAVLLSCALALLSWGVHSAPYNPLAPRIDPTVGDRGLMIDAGSSGSRLHIFSWQPRVFDVVPPPLSIPNSDEKTTERIRPGISDFVDDYPGLRSYFATLLDECKQTLKPFEKDWHTYPIYLRATGGMRLVPIKKREDMMTYIRTLFSDKEFCPFYFQYDFARVMSGEEEAAFAWAGSNYLFKTLFPNLQHSDPIQAPSHDTYGTVDLGGASVQISFFVPNQDISEGLFNLQIGSQRHWNIYAKSFLKYGYNSARERHLQSIADEAIARESGEAITSCFFSGYSEIVSTSRNDTVVPIGIEVKGPKTAQSKQFSKCVSSLKPLMQKELNSFCNTVYDGECSMDGFYQPNLPTGQNGHFIGSANFKYPWYFLQMPETGTINDFKNKSQQLCAMNYDEVKEYNENVKLSVRDDDNLNYYCFFSCYVATLLEYGFGFSDDQTFTVVDSVDGHKLGWALGSMLHEINGLPFVFRPLTWHYYLLQSLGNVLIGAAMGVVGTWLYLFKTNKTSMYERIPDQISSL